MSIQFPTEPPKGFIHIPDSKAWHAATVFYASTAFSDRVQWVERHKVTVKPGETWQEAFKRQFGVKPDPREIAFVPAGLYS
jgi:hypothetical protein